MIDSLAVLPRDPTTGRLLTPQIASALCVKPRAQLAPPQATRAYAWSSPIEGSEQHRIAAVLQLGAIKTSLDAVRAAIVAKHRRPQHDA